MSAKSSITGPHTHTQIVDFPDLSGNIPTKQSYGVFVSQLIRYARCCMSFEDFVFRTKKLVTRLTNQNFRLGKLKQVFQKFAESNYELLFKYNHSINNICGSCYWYTDIFLKVIFIMLCCLKSWIITYISLTTPFVKQGR